MYHYTFTDEQLFSLLKALPNLAREYVQVHGYPQENADAQAANDTIEGLIAEQKKVDAGETLLLTQIYSKQKLCPFNLLADAIDQAGDAFCVQGRCEWWISEKGCCAIRGSIGPSRCGAPHC